MGTFQCIVFKRLRVKKRACPGQHERLNELCKRLIISAAPLWGGLTGWNTKAKTQKQVKMSF
jgi:hypothetical protein